MENDQTVTIDIPTDNPQDVVAPTQPQQTPLSTSNPQTDVWSGDNCIEKECEHYKAWLSSQVAKATPKAPPVPGAGMKCYYCENKEKIQVLADEYVNKHSKQGEKLTVPFVQELAVLLSVSRSSVYEWSKKKIAGTDILEHPEFAETIDKLMTIQELRLLQRTLGRYNPTGAIFQLKTNHGYMESEKKVVTGDSNEPLIVEIVEQKRRAEENE